MLRYLTIIFFAFNYLIGIAKSGTIYTSSKIPIYNSLANASKD